MFVSVVGWKKFQTNRNCGGVCFVFFFTFYLHNGFLLGKPTFFVYWCSGWINIGFFIDGKMMFGLPFVINFADRLVFSFQPRDGSFFSLKGSTTQTLDPIWLLWVLFMQYCEEKVLLRIPDTFFSPLKWFLVWLLLFDVETIKFLSYSSVII
jgi:hypothetical protein